MKINLYWGLGIGDGDWGLGIGQSPIPHPQYPNIYFIIKLI
jgi:hypothetical protein